MKKLTLAILFAAATAITTQASAEPPRSKTLRAAFEAAQANHRAEMQAIRLEANLMSEASPEKGPSRQAVAEARGKTGTGNKKEPG